MAGLGKRHIGRIVDKHEARTPMAAQPACCPRVERVGTLPIAARLSDDGSDLTCDRVRRLIKSRTPERAHVTERKSRKALDRARRAEHDGAREERVEHKAHVEKQNQAHRYWERETPRERERRRAREKERYRDHERQKQKDKERERRERSQRKLAPAAGPKRTSRNELIRDSDPRTLRMWKFRDDTKNDPKLVGGKRINARERDNLFRTIIRTSVVKRLGFDPYYIYHFGERGSGLRHHGALQDFYQIREYHLGKGTLFEDPQFPCEDQSLYFSRRPNYRVEWLRPGEISDNPRLFVEGFSRFDVQQGELGDCWLLAAVANLTMYHRLFFQVVPDDQSYYDKYAGVFHFRFWQYGRWIDVVIDDRLPTRHGQLLYLRSSTENEFWSALLEKAYAKLHGSYEALKGGSTCEAMEDFTGGVTEMYELSAAPADLYKIMLKAFERGSLMGCSIEPDPHEVEARTPDGLVKGHAYSITKVKFVEIQTPNTRGKIPLLRLRNPWGDDTEWNGAWSDQSPEWRFIPDAEKNELGLTFDSDGEFWMSYKDFVDRFDRVELCNLNPDSLDQNSTMKKWEVSYYEGSWVRGVTAGGCRNFIQTFANNPQYRITLTETDEEENDGKCTVIVALMQKNRRSQRMMGLEELSIGFVLYYIRDPNSAPKPLDCNFFKHNAIVARCPSYINLREVSCRFRLSPGTYCIVPSTFDPDEEGEFLLRVYSEHQNNMEYGSNHVGGDDNAPTYRPPSPPTYRPPTPPPRDPRSINAGGFGGFGDFGLGDFGRMAGGGGEGGHGGGIGGFLNDILNSRFSFNFQQPGGGQGSSQAQAGQQHTAPYPPSNQAPYPAYPQGGAPPYPTQPAPYPQRPNMPYPQQQPYPAQPQYPAYPPQPPYPGLHDNDVNFIKKKPMADEPNAHQLWSNYRMEDAFQNFAGTSEEINWLHLQKLLKVALKKDVESEFTQTSVGHADTANTSIPQTQRPEDVAGSLINIFFDFLCMTVCKDTELATEYASKQEEVPLMCAQPQEASNVDVGFGDDVCRSILAMYDDDFSGKMGLSEFQQMWSNMIGWIAVFNEHDRDKSNNLSGFELREALGAAGYSVNNHTLNLLMLRYGTNGSLNLDSFIMSIIKINHMVETFKRHESDAKAEFTLDEFLNATIYS